MPPPREDGEPAATYFLREYVIPGVIFALMVRWLVLNVVVPMARDRFYPTRVTRNPNDDNDFIAPEHPKMK